MTTSTPRGRQMPGAGGVEAIEHVGPFDMSVGAGTATPQAAERWDRRAEALAAWLAAQLIRTGFHPAPEVGSLGRSGVSGDPGGMRMTNGEPP